MSEQPPAPEPPADAATLAYPLVATSPHAAAPLAAGRPVRFYLVSLIGMTAETVAPLIATTATVLRGDGFVPVFVTDLTDYAVFRDAGVIFESVPPRAGSARLAPDLDWDARRREAMGLIQQKWRPVAHTVLGHDLTAAAQP